MYTTYVNCSILHWFDSAPNTLTQLHLALYERENSTFITIKKLEQLDRFMTINFFDPRSWEFLNAYILESCFRAKSNIRQFAVLSANWEPEGCYQYSKLFCWEPEGHYHFTKSMVIAPMWLSMAVSLNGHSALLTLNWHYFISGLWRFRLKASFKWHTGWPRKNATLLINNFKKMRDRMKNLCALLRIKLFF